MASDAESDGFGLFDLSEFTPDDFAHIDNLVTSHFEPPPISTVLPIDQVATANESFEFDASLDLFNLTEEDFLEIDNAVTLQLKGSTPPVKDASIAGPSKETVKSPFAQPETRRKFVGRKKPWAKRTLLEKYRPFGSMSVTDLVGPAWCEVQYDYGLRQRRDRPITKRPKSFKTATGKEIAVEMKIADVNDVRTKQGQAMHKELEREIRAEELKVDLKYDEDRWGLRLLNMITCLQDLITDGMTREMPTFGMVDGEVVAGIIDEIDKVERKPDPSPKRRTSHTRAFKPSKRQRRTPSPSEETDIEDIISPNHFIEILPPPKTQAKNPPAHFSLRVSDTKTRVRDSLPPKEDTQSPRLQVMLYHRLLSELVSTKRPYDFNAVWYQLGLDSSRKFSTQFMVTSGLLADNKDFPVTNLDELVELWRSTLEVSSIANVDPWLQLVYRLQPSAEPGKEKGKQPLVTDEAPPRKHSSSSPSSDEARDIARAIRNSLLESAGQPDGDGKEVSEGPTTSRPPAEEEVIALDADPPADEVYDVELQKVLVQSWAQHLPEGVIVRKVLDPNATSAHNLNAAAEPPAKPDSPTPPAARNEVDIHGYKIIGKTRFVYDERMLQDHLDSVLEFWREQRPPRGVPEELARRCYSCEYRNGCEWREEKAIAFGLNRALGLGKR